MKSYAVLLAPEFRLQAALRSNGEGNDRPAALLEASGKHICELNQAAFTAGVEEGMTPTQALARCVDLRFWTGNAGHERSAQEALLQAAERISPFLESTQSGVVTLELPEEKSIPEQAFVDRIVTPLIREKLAVRIGVAETPELASLAAQFAAPVQIVSEPVAFLAPLPIAALEPTKELLTILRSWGIRKIGQLVALPRAQVCERLGPEAVKLWEKATGGRPRPLSLIKPHAFYQEQTDLENPVEMLEPLLFLLRRFLEQIAVRLANGYLVAGKLRLVLRFERDDPYQRTFVLPQPTREVDLLFRMLHTHLENFTAQSAIIGLELAAKPVRPPAEQFGLLEKGVRDPYRFAETLARLQGLLGSDCLGTPKIEASHHPDAFHLCPYETQVPLTPSSAEPLLGIPCLRFRPPLRAEVGLEGMRPAFISSERGTGRILESRGPWLLEGNWWDAQSWSREEWDVAAEDGFYRLVHVDDAWFLDGIYA